MRLPLLLAALVLPCAAAQEAEIEPVCGFLSSDSAPLSDVSSTLPLHLTNAVLLTPGQWQLVVTATRRRYVGASDGHDSMGTGEILGEGYTLAPRSMTSDSTLVQALLGLDEDNTLLAMLPWVSNRMKVVSDTGANFTQEAEGLGDLNLGLTHRAWQGEGARVLVYGGVSLPTGSYDEADDIPGSPDQTMDYVMQPGSGTVDLRPALTWLDDRRDWVFGLQLAVVQRLGRNSQDWSGPNEQELSVWATQRLDEVSSISGRVSARNWGDVHGADDDLDPAVSPTQDPDRQAGQRIDMVLDYRTGGFVLEGGLPLYQHLDGPQLELNWFVSAGWRFSF
jgi:hypothetical protein